MTTRMCKRCKNNYDDVGSRDLCDTCLKQSVEKFKIIYLDKETEIVLIQVDYGIKTKICCWLDVEGEIKPVYFHVFSVHYYVETLHQQLPIVLTLDIYPALDDLDDKKT